MEEFLETTTFHGWRRVAGASKPRRFVWTVILTGMYVYLVYGIYEVCRDYMDPRNLKSVITFGSSGDYPNDSAVVPVHFPRLVLCAEKPGADLSRYKDVEIQFGDEIRPLPPLRMTYTRRRPEPFHSLEMCSTIDYRKIPKKIRIHWGELNASLRVMLSIGDSDARYPEVKETRVTRLVRRQGDQEQERPFFLEPNINLVIRITPIQVHQIHVGPDSPFSNSYPEHLEPSFPAYNIGHCVDLLYLQWLLETGNTACHDKYKIILDELKDSSGEWKGAEAYGCEMNYDGKEAFLDCGCSPDSWLDLVPNEEKWQDEVDKHCKKSYLNIYWQGSPWRIKPRKDGSTRVSFKFVTPQFIKTTQLPAMGWEDVSSKIGGFLGLLIGASLISFLELIEFVFTSLYRKISRSIIPVNDMSLEESDDDDDDDSEK